MPVIYALSHVPPEVSAYGMAKYSRSSASMRDSLLELSQQKAEAFLNTFYFSYGHASIADLAHVPLAIEQISLLAAMDVVDEALWDGQERSTRYQDFTESPYYMPDAPSTHYARGIEALFALYRSIFAAADTALQSRYAKPENMKEALYRRTLKARAFDLARYALPLATLTSLGQVTNARVLEQQIRRLMTSECTEVREIARGMKAAVTDALPFNLLEARLHHLGIPIAQPIAQEMNPGPIAPTLTKYTDADQYRIKRQTYLAQVVKDLFPGFSEAKHPVVLHALENPLDDLLAGLIYGASGLSYEDIRERMTTLSIHQKETILGEVLGFRGAHDDWPRELQQRPLIFDVTIDVGAYRDLNRHRRLDKVVQPLDARLGYDLPPEFQDVGLTMAYQTVLDTHYASLTQYPLEERPYLMPLAHRRRALLRMDFAEAAYLIELRSRSSGHFSYRRMANAMHAALITQYPSLRQAIRVTPFEQFDPFER